MKRFVASIALAIFAFALPASAQARSSGFYFISASTSYCVGGSVCDIWTGPATGISAYLTLSNQEHPGRIATPDQFSVGCFKSYFDGQGVRHYQEALAYAGPDATVQGVAGILTPGDTSTSTAVWSAVFISFTDPAHGLSGTVRGTIETDNVTHTLVSGGLHLTLTGTMTNSVVGVGQYGQPFLYPEPSTTGSITCHANVNGSGQYDGYYALYPVA